METVKGAVGIDIISPSHEQLVLLEATLQQVPLNKYVETKEERIVAAQVQRFILSIINYHHHFKIYNYRFIWSMS